MIWRINCPYCDGRVKTLVHGVGQEYAGRQRYCRTCGTIWRMEKDKHRALLIGAFLATLLPGVLPYFFLKPRQADIWCPAWVVAFWGLIWPVFYYVVWRRKVKIKPKK